MNLTDVAKTAASVGLTALGDALGGPEGGVIASRVAKWLGLSNANPETINAALGNPKFEIQLKQIDANIKIAEINAATEQQQTVNKTMQTEAQSKHWAQWAWRPYNGFLFGTTLFLNYALPSILNTLAPLFMAHWVAVTAQSMPQWVFIAWGGILGVDTWHNGRALVARAKAVINGSGIT